MSDVAEFQLAGQTAVVTGSSSGIGRAIALELARCGADVVVHARRSREGAEQTAAEIRQSGRQSQVFMADLAEPAEQDRLAEEAWQWRGSLDIWINCAGVDLLTGEATRWTFEQKLEALWRVDVTASLRLAREVGRRMKARGRGVLLNIGWDQADHGMAGDSGELFGASKGAVMAHTKSLALSLAPEVRINCLAPGWIKTSWGETASAAWQERAKREAQLGRWGEPSDVARTARFLVSEESSFVTGQVWAVNGGFQES
ncbi:MAG: SDR family oxidoreductase [Pirellulales bacterium]|nr:SDR family oxidoreductase [Pirellulales bacterium]